MIESHNSWWSFENLKYFLQWMSDYAIHTVHSNFHGWFDGFSKRKKIIPLEMLTVWSEAYKYKRKAIKSWLSNLTVGFISIEASYYLIREKPIIS